MVPFVDALADQMPDSATRLRRDFASLLSLVRTHTILYRARREINDEGHLIATLEGDYAPVRELVSDVIAEGVEATVSTATRATVEAVRESIENGASHATPGAVISRLELGRSAGYDRIKRALSAGYLINLAARGERAMKLTPGAPLPSDGDFLPAVETLVRVMSGSRLGHAAPERPRDSTARSGSPARPAAPRIGTHASAEATEQTAACPRHDNKAQWWLARDGLRRCLTCQPPAFSREVVAIKGVP